jgi:hypothetical protein
VDSAGHRSAARALSELERLAPRFGEGGSARKLELLRTLERADLATRAALVRLHEVVCFLRALPDDAALLWQVERMAERFASRRDLRRLRAGLADSGLAGTDIRYSFYAPTARWLAARWGERLFVDWDGMETEKLLEDRLQLIVCWGETPALDEIDDTPRGWVRSLKGPAETDGRFLVERFARLGANGLERDRIYEELDLPLVLRGGPDTPSRTRARLPGRPVHYQTRPLRRERPDLRRELAIPPRSVRAVGPRRGAQIIDLAREAMVTRARDLDAFMYGDPRDVRLVDCGDGLELACIGVKPERRLLLEAVYGFLTLKNGVPIGYVLTSALHRSSEIAYNVFDTWRGGEAGHVYGRVLAMARHLFGSDAFTIYPYQLGGGGNTEGLRSGAWWFYQKLGFRPRDPAVLRLMRRELARMRKRPSYRSSLATLERLAEENVYWFRGRPREDVIGVFPASAVGLAISRYLARRFGSDRERGELVCAQEAARLCGLRARPGRTAGERLAWRRWGPLVRILPGVERWSAAERKALVQVALAKGGRRESDFVRLFDDHRKLRAALKRLAARAG